VQERFQLGEGVLESEKLQRAGTTDGPANTLPPLASTGSPAAGVRVEERLLRSRRLDARYQFVCLKEPFIPPCVELAIRASNWTLMYVHPRRSIAKLGYHRLMT
jgi:hypothetical protein